MAVFKIARFEVRPDARVIRADDPAADDRHRNAPGTQAFVAALYPLVVGEVEFTDYELVTSSDLHRRPRTNTKR